MFNEPRFFYSQPLYHSRVVAIVTVFWFPCILGPTILGNQASAWNMHVVKISILGSWLEDWF